MTHRPLNVVVIGNSVTYQQIPPRTRSDEGIYAEVLRDDVAAATGRPVNLYLEGGWFDLIDTAARRYEQSIRNHLPDVVVLHYGTNEAQPYLVPLRVLRHLIRHEPAVTRLGHFYRTKVVTAVWRVLRAYRQAASRILGERTWQLRPSVFTATLTHLATAIRRDMRALVLIVDINEPGDRLEHFLPGSRGRVRTYRATLEKAVRQIGDPDVRLVPVSGVTRSLGIEAALPDGIHFSNEAHARFGAELAEQVLAWLPTRDATTTDDARPLDVEART
ncbi:lysophospholipase L1-like esterase [Actinoalloteichus hoggarensis]|uniref:Uncharacterized protein n=1 Tax=Actinoalloteichus hoggarensis TaxID=1470176 RepID=A0A221W4W7_9PSEU|nr:SGNH/GDSL hydrolase family protein [Actinoalloteichus hoggarensis]ASO20696.1 hypothetical protein AHOG_15350 [Actinoalloteichus hoggarensis]MBB5924451.1 lysophospholipase L1-like esterase [Actinoalloteichus hoggarensis]